MGYTVITITTEHTLLYENFDMKARQIARRLGKRLARETPELRERRIELMRRLFSDMHHLRENAWVLDSPKPMQELVGFQRVRSVQAHS